MTTDHALIAAAARAAGKLRAEWDFDYLAERGVCVSRDMLWNPLTSNGDALWLAVKVPRVDLEDLIREAWDACDNQDAACTYVRRAITIAAGALVA